MESFVTSVHLATAVFMILVVLVQGGTSGGVGAAFGGGNSQGVFGATGANPLLSKLTYGAALVFMMTSIGLTVIQAKSAKTGLKERLEQTDKESSSQAPSVEVKPNSELLSPQPEATDSTQAQ